MEAGELIQTIATTLNEPAVDLIRRVVRVCGPERTQAASRPSKLRRGKGCKRDYVQRIMAGKNQEKSPMQQYAGMRHHLILCLVLLNLLSAGQTQAPAFPADRTGSQPGMSAPLLLEQREEVVTPASTAPQWQVWELPLTAVNPVANPYTDVTLTASFTGPNHQQTLVPGFWNGGSNFLIRFTPTMTGTWTYTTTAIPGDPGLSTQGTLTVTTAAADARGFVRRDPAHPYSFIFDNGERYFMMGQTYYEIIRTARANHDTNTAWQTAIRNAKAYGINKIRLLTHPWNTTDPTPRRANFYPRTAPFINNDHDQLDIAYWQRLDDVVEYIGAQDMVADLIFFTNTSDAFGTLAQDKRYVRYVVARYAAYPHVIWCLSNEWQYTNRDTDNRVTDRHYWDGIGTLVKNVDPWMREESALRPLSIHPQTRVDFEFFPSAWPVHAIIQVGVRNTYSGEGDEWGNYGVLLNREHNLPIVNDEYGYIGEDQVTRVGDNVYDQTRHRQALWGIGIGGGYAAAGDGRIFPDGPKGEPGRIIFTAHWHDAPEYKDIKRFVDFWTINNLEYWKMTPQNQLITAGTRAYVLGQPGQAYVIYAAVGGTVKLTLPEGTYTATRFDPKTGASVALPAQPGDTALSFTLPDATDWVLHLTRSTP